MAPIAAPLPLLPSGLLRRHYCLEPTDTRFRAVARLHQSLWREAYGFPCGRVEDTSGRSRRLGSRLTARIARTGANLIDPVLVPWARRELAYREIGALIETERFWGRNTVQIERVVERLRAGGAEIDPADLAHVWPLQHARIIPNGTYFLGWPQNGTAEAAPA